MKPNNTSNTTSDTLTSPITPAQFAEYMSLDYDASDDALLNGFLLTACEICIAYTNRELSTRNYSFELDRFPDSDSAMSGIASIGSMRRDWIDLPLAPVSSITAITVDDVAYTDFTADLKSSPARIIFNSIVSGNIVITYAAGTALAANIDSRLILGIKMLAAYLFDNRGCDTSEAIKLSGASTVWGQTKMFIGGL